MISALHRLRLLPLLLAILLMVGALPVGAAPEDADDVKIISLIGEENDVPAGVYYYNGQTQYNHNNYRPASGVFNWTTGRNNGTALALDGKNQFLRLPTASLTDITAFTFSSWVYWNSDTTAQDDVGQKLVTVYHNEYHYLFVSLHAADAEASLNGIMIEWATPGNEPKRVFTPVNDGSSFAFPVGEWHHTALTISEQQVVLYVDGHAFLTADIAVDLADMQPPKLRVGAGFAATEKRLDALLQNTVVYTAALDSNQILLLAQDSDPFSGQTATTVTDPLATRPTSSAVEKERNDGYYGVIFGIPAPLMFTVGGILITVVLLSVVLSIWGNRQKKEGSK